MQAPAYFHSRTHPLVWLLWPVAWLFAGLVGFRRWLYQRGILPSAHFPVPVLVVGNISLGGTGKTPLVVALAQLLRDAGFRPGIVLRGYRGKAQAWPCLVDQDTDPALVGDEAVLLAMRTGCPVCAGPSRSKAVELLLANSACDMIISDDGLQHYALARDLEIAVVDGATQQGNGFLLPAGPLREKPARLKRCDFVITNTASPLAGYWMTPKLSRLVNLMTDDTRPLTYFAGQKVHALAGIGNPQRFYDLLEQHGYLLQRHSFDDHHAYVAADLDFPDTAPVIMTEKDAVKCRAFAHDRCWFVPMELELDPGFTADFLQRFQHIALQKKRELQ